LVGPVHYNTAAKLDKTKMYCKKDDNGNCQCKKLRICTRNLFQGMETVLTTIDSQFMLNTCAIKGNYYGNYTVATCQRTRQFTLTTLIIKLLCSVESQNYSCHKYVLLSTSHMPIELLIFSVNCHSCCINEYVL